MGDEQAGGVPQPPGAERAAGGAEPAGPPELPPGQAGAAGPPPAGLDERLPATLPRAARGVRVAAALALVAAAGLVAAFTGVGPADLDSALLTESIEDRTAGLTAAATVVTDVGSTAAMAVLAVLLGIACWVRGRRADAVLAVGAMAGASVLFLALKMLLDRPRPPEVDRLLVVTNQSLPSGHATMSVVVIGTVVVLVWAGRGRAARVAIVVVAAAWVAAVGATRVYLGVHWFSDVIAGWLVGAAWLAACVVVWARRRSPG